MGMMVSSMVNSVNPKHSMSLSSRGPDWSLIPSAGKSGRSKAEFTEEIRELARRAAGTTDKKELEYIHSQRARLCAKYISDVSPDRKALYRQAENVLKEQGGNPKCKGIGELTLLDFLEAADGRTDSLAEKKFALAGGGTLTCPILTSGGHGADIDYQGTKVLTYLGPGYGWACERTPAEREKEREFYEIYFNAYRSLKNGKEEKLEALPDSLKGKSSFDRKV